MSRIDRLLNEVSPGGVKYRQLGEIGRIYGGLTGKSKADFSGGNARFVSYINVFRNESVDLDEDVLVTLGESERQNRVTAGDVLFTSSSENAEEVGMSSVVTTEPETPLYLNSFCFGFRMTEPEALLPGFSRHLFRSRVIRSQIIRTASGVTRFNVSKSRFLGVRIPVPPVEVQREIVAILDTFSELEAELDMELEARREQYRRFKKNLLTGAVSSEVALGDVCRVFSGFAFKSTFFNLKEDGLPVVRIRDINTGFSNTFYSGEFDAKFIVNDGDILIGMDGDFKAIRWTNGKSLLNQRVCRLQGFGAQVLPDYVFYVAREAIARIQTLTTASTVKHLSSKQISAIRIPLRPLEDQQVVVNGLNAFDSLVSDLGIGLPAELIARRKQYEYYRDRLMTFEEMPA